MKLQKGYSLSSYLSACWRCGEKIRIYFVHEGQRSYDALLSNDADPDNSPAVAEWLLKNVPSIKRMWSRTMRGHSVVNVCPCCNSIQGNWYVYHNDDAIGRAEGDIEVKSEKFFVVEEEMDEQEEWINLLETLFHLLSEEYRSRCEMCGRKSATIEHHVRYDPPEIMRICNKCHSAIHSAHFPSEFWQQNRREHDVERQRKKQEEREELKERLAKERPKGWERRLGLLPTSDPVARTLARSGKFRIRKEWK